MPLASQTPPSSLKGPQRFALASVVLGGAALVAFQLTAVVEAMPREGGLSKASVTKSLPKAKAVVKQVDQLMAAEWRKEKVKPRKQASDSEFLRRVHLDIAGVVPDEKRARRFLASKSKHKRAELIEELLADDAYARTMGLRWAYLLVGRQYLIRMQGVKRRVQRLKRMQANARKRAQEDMEEGMEGMDGEKKGAGGMEGYPERVLTLTEWLSEKLKANKSWGEISRDLIGAEGTTWDNPAIHYMLKHARNGKAAEATGSVMRVFQGLQLQCTQCHNDKLDSGFTQHSFWGIAAFFARTRARRLPPPGMTRAEARKAKKRGPFQIVERGRNQIRMPAPKGEVGQLVLPTFLTGDVVSPGPRVQRRVELAKLITNKKNPYFARATVNRIWSFFFGRGIIQPVDAVNQDDHVLPKVMDLLVEDFKRSDYDLKRLVRIVANTRAYGLSSAGPEEGKADELAFFARGPLRSLSAEQLFYSVLSATGMEDLSTANRRARRRIERMKFRMLAQFVRTFGNDESDEALDEGTIPQALLRLNGPLTNDAVRARPGHPVYDRLFREENLDKRIETIYLRVLSRFPTKKERKVLRTFLKRKEARYALGQARAYADVFWALLNGTEFNLNH